jgi:nitrile hydratase
MIGAVERVIEPAGIDDEEEGFGRNAGDKRHCYRVAFRMSDLAALWRMVK